MRSTHMPLLMIAAAALAVAGLTGCAAQQHEAGPRSTAAAAALPASFPSASVPIVPGRIITAGGDRTNGWTVTVQPTDVALSDAESKLEERGFRATSTSPSRATLSDDDYTVFLQTPGKAITYVVTAAR